MRFSKIKWDEKVVILEWTTTEKDAKVEHCLPDGGAPGRGLIDALAGFRDLVRQIIGVGAEWMGDVRVTSLSIETGKNGRRGLVITAIKPLPNYNGVLVINTPHLRERMPEDTGDVGYFLPGTEALIEAADAAATAYLDGERQQLELLPEAAA